MSKLRQLPTAKLSPRTLLHQLLEDHTVEGLIVITIDTDGSHEVATTNITCAQVAFAAVGLLNYAQECARGEHTWDPNADDPIK